MSDLDLSGLTDDQLVELVKACCEEAIKRNPAVTAAAKSVMLTEAERLQILKNATEGELAAARARERQRVAREEVERMRQEEVAKQAELAAKKAEECEWRDRALLRQAGELLGRSPAQLALLFIHSAKYGHQVYINENADRYTRDHLCTLAIQTGEIRTKKQFMKKKPELARFMAKLASDLPVQTHVVGHHYDWPKETT